MMSDFFVFLGGSTARFRRFATLFSAVAFLVCSFFGCSRGTAEELFFYRKADIRADVSLICNGAESRFSYERIGDVSRAEFTYPQELEGFVLELTSEAAFVSCDGLRAEAPDTLALIPRLAYEIFSLSPEAVTLVETVDNVSDPQTALTKISVSEVSVTVDGNGIPVGAEGVLFGVSFRADIAEFSVITL